MTATKPKVHVVVIEHDTDADFSWLEQSMYDPASSDYEPTWRTKADMDAGREPLDPEWYRDPDNHVALCMVAYDDEGNVLDSLGGIDFLADSDDWKTGTFGSLRALKGCPDLQELAHEMGLR
jgi:hypothetical protein